MAEQGPSTLKELLRLSTIGVGMVAATAIGLLLGYGLDSLLGTRPWLTLIFAILGIVAGFLNMLRDVGLLKRRP
jgi:ATP synthase protein I